MIMTLQRRRQQREQQQEQQRKQQQKQHAQSPRSRQPRAGRRIAAKAVAAATTGKAAARRRGLAKRESRAVRVGGRRILVADDRTELAKDILGVPARLETPQLDNAAILGFEDNDDDNETDDHGRLDSISDADSFESGSELGSYEANDENDDDDAESAAHRPSLIPHFQARAEEGFSQSRRESTPSKLYHKRDPKCKDQQERAVPGGSKQNDEQHVPRRQGRKKGNEDISKENESKDGIETQTQRRLSLEEFVQAKEKDLKRRTSVRLKQSKREQKQLKARENELKAKKQAAEAQEMRSRKARNLQRGAEHIQEQQRRRQQARVEAQKEAKRVETFCQEAFAEKKAKADEQRAQLQKWRRKKQELEQNFLVGVVLPDEYAAPDAKADPELFGTDLLTRHLGYKVTE